MKIATLNELNIIFSKTKSKVFATILTIIPIIIFLLYLVAKNKLGIFVLSETEFSLGILSKISTFLLPLFILVMSIDIFCEELPEIAILRPISRYKVYISKILAVTIYSFILLIGVFAISTILSFFVLLIGDNLNVFFINFLKSLFSYIIAGILMSQLSIIVSFFAQLFKSTSGTILFMIILYIALNFTMWFYPDISFLYPLTYITSTFYFSDISNLLYTLMILFSYSIIFLSSGIFIFDKKEY